MLPFMLKYLISLTQNKSGVCSPSILSSSELPTTICKNWSCFHGVHDESTEKGIRREYITKSLYLTFSTPEKSWIGLSFMTLLNCWASYWCIAMLFSAYNSGVLDSPDHQFQLIFCFFLANVLLSASHIFFLVAIIGNSKNNYFV